MQVDDARLIVPAVDPDELWPSLGGQVCEFIEANLVHGPGDMLGEPVQLTEEERLFLWRVYEVYPRDHDQAGRRRFKRAVFSRRKGVGKTELAALVAICEMDPSAPVRCDGWRKVGKVYEPAGRPVRDPYIPMVAVGLEQVEDLTYGAVRAILTSERCRLVDDYDAGLERIVHRSAPGLMKAMTSAPGAREGARTSFQSMDETHLWVGPRHLKLHSTMLRNTAKRAAADAWTMETTTAFGPGEGSVAEASMRYARDVAAGKLDGVRLLMDHRQASEVWNLDDPDQLRAAVLEASGDAVAYGDIEGILAQWHDPQVDESDCRRYWLNQPRRLGTRWLPAGAFEAAATPRRGWPAEGTRVVLAFDGSYSRASTALVGATVEQHPYLFTVGVWERPATDPTWRVPRNAVTEAVAVAMLRWDVAELAPDPPGWHREVEDWEADWPETVVRFETRQPARMGPAVDEYYQAVNEGNLSHDGSEPLVRHHRNALPTQRRGHTVIVSAGPDTTDYIDAAVAAVVAHHRALWHHVNAVAPVDPTTQIW